MRCPSCGEPIQSRHTFCVVCGADLQDVLSRSKKEAVGEATEKIHSVLTKPITLRKPKHPAEEKPAPKKEAPTSVMAPPEDTPDDSGLLPGFMRKYV